MLPKSLPRVPVRQALEPAAQVATAAKSSVLCKQETYTHKQCLKFCTGRPNARRARVVERKPVPRCCAAKTVTQITGCQNECAGRPRPTVRLLNSAALRRHTRRQNTLARAARRQSAARPKKLSWGAVRGSQNLVRQTLHADLRA